MKLGIFSVLSIFFYFHLFAQNFTEIEAQIFVTELLDNAHTLNNYYNPEELIIAERLGISYHGVKHKYLLDNIIKINSIKHPAEYELEITNLEENISKLLIHFPVDNVKLEFLFENLKIVSKPKYYSRNWMTEESKYFIFHISDITLINSYSIKKLDNFVEDLLIILHISDVEKERIQEQKIHYFLCKNDSEIKLLSEHSTRGMYNVANDYVISIFNCHLHEVAHLLINYKLQHLDLFTIPLLQEGFAVAFGGRGGKESNVILDMGLFLINSDFIHPNFLISSSEFYQFDASLTYPVAGLFVNFLLQEIGVESFLELYKKYSTNVNDFHLIKIDTDNLPDSTKWKRYISNKINQNDINVIIEQDSFPKLTPKTHNIIIYENENDYLIKMKKGFCLKTNDVFVIYESNLHKELMTTRKYNSEKYFLNVNSEEISIYNLYTNCIIGKYVRSFSLNYHEVQQHNEYFIFSVKKDIFDEPLDSLEIVECD